MIRKAFLLPLLILSSILYSQVNVISYNIRYNNPNDGEHAWPGRKADVINLLKFHKADIFCLQEALVGQVNEIDRAFQEYDYVGVGRDDGKKAGEYAPVFYDANRFKKIHSGHFWLSETPGIPALGWDADCIRICSWVRLQEKSSDKQFVVFNTHFDHIGMEARKNAADLILHKIQSLAANEPVILCGDLNLPPESVPVRKISAMLNDSFTVSELPPHASVSTWSGFTYDNEQGDRIDYIFVSKDIKVLRYAGLTDARNKRYFSDHLPVFAEIDF